MMHEKEEYDLAMSKAAGIISKLVADQHQPIIEGKSPQEAWNILQEHFQHINPMSTSQIIYKASTKKLSDTLSTHQSDKHLSDHLRGHHQEAVRLQERS